MSIEHKVLDDGTIHTTGEVDGVLVNITTAPGIIPPFSTKLASEDASWRVQVTYKGRQKSNSDGGLQDKHAQAWRGWPSIKHRTVSTKI